jgi:hypothetical protein
MAQILDVAIGLSLIFFLFSVLVSAVQELMASTLNWRGRGWEEAVQRWLDGTFKPSHFIGQRFRLSRRTDLPATSLAAAVLSHGALTSLMKDERLPSYAPAEAVSNALIDELRKRAHDEAPTAEGLRWAIASLGNQALREQLEPILQQSGGDLAAVRRLIARAYDQVMDRASGRYKRFSQVVQLVLGMLVAILFNVDAIYIGQVLTASEALRTELVAVAKETVDKNKAAEDGETDAILRAYGDIAALNLPIGLPVREEQSWWFIGWLITALALSQGAPFWFDLMANLVRVRGAGKKPETSTGVPSTTPDQAIPVAAGSTGEPHVDASEPANEFERTSLSKDDVLRLQSRLQAVQTGKLDAATRRALRDFQRKSMVPATGEVSLELMRALWPMAFRDAQPVEQEHN